MLHFALQQLSLTTYFTKYGKTPSPKGYKAMDSVARTGHPSSQQGLLAQPTVSTVVFHWDWADKGISFQVEKHKLYLYADNFLFVGFSSTGWISGLSLQCSPTTWNIFTIVWVGVVLPEAGEMPQSSCCGRQRWKDRASPPYSAFSVRSYHRPEHLLSICCHLHDRFLCHWPIISPSSVSCILMTNFKRQIPEV